MVKKTLCGIQAGIMIAIGGSVFLSAENRVVGAVLFSVALLCICQMGYSLFTGKVGYMAFDHGKEAYSVLLLGLLGNAIATILCGKLVAVAIPALQGAAETICTAKLGQSFWQCLIRSVFCGVLMYLAVSIFKEKKTMAGIFFCVPCFILSGFEHSIANMFYFSLSGIVSLEAFAYLMVVIAGNAIGGLLMPLLSLPNKKEG